MELLTPPQVAELLQLSYVSVWRLTRSGDLPSIRIGRSIRIRREDLEQFVARCRVMKDT